MSEDHLDTAEVDTTESPESSVMKSVRPLSVSVKPHSRVKALSFALGVDSINSLVSDFEHAVSQKNVIAAYKHFHNILCIYSMIFLASINTHALFHFGFDPLSKH